MVLKILLRALIGLDKRHGTIVAPRQQCARFGDLLASLLLH
jgi:hypothetical protein